MVCYGHKDDLELVGFECGLLLCEWLNACLPQFDPISSGIVDGPLIDQCRGQYKARQSCWDSGPPCFVLVVPEVLAVQEVVLVEAVLAGDLEEVAVAVVLVGLDAVAAG